MDPRTSISYIALKPRTTLIFLLELSQLWPLGLLSVGHSAAFPCHHSLKLFFFFLSAPLLFGTPGCTIIVTYISCSSPRSSHPSKEPWLLLLGSRVQTRSRCPSCLLPVVCACFWASQLAARGNGWMHTNPRVPQSCLSVGANQEFTSMTLILILSVLIILASSPRGSKASPPAWQTWLPLSPRPPFGSSAADQCVVESEVNPCPRPRPQAPAAATGPGLMHSPFCL